MMPRRRLPRRDLCHATGRRAGKLNQRQAARAWTILAQRLEALGEMDLPKFRHLLEAIRSATVGGRRMSISSVTPEEEKMDTVEKKI